MKAEILKTMQADMLYASWCLRDAAKYKVPKAVSKELHKISGALDRLHDNSMLLQTAGDSPTRSFNEVLARNLNPDEQLHYAELLPAPAVIEVVEGLAESAADFEAQYDAECEERDEAYSALEMAERRISELELELANAEDRIDELEAELSEEAA